MGQRLSGTVTFWLAAAGTQHSIARDQPVGKIYYHDFQNMRLFRDCKMKMWLLKYIYLSSFG